MASAAEQLAASINFSSIAKASELKKRLWFTLGALIVYRLGTFIPVPGVDARIMAEVFESLQGGLGGMLNVFSGGALERMSIFALNIMPYITATIIMQLMTAVSPKIEALKKEGEIGRKKINQYSRMLTVLLATVQGLMIARSLEGFTGSQGLSAVIFPGLQFQFVAVVTLVGGTMFLMWLGEQITMRGVGNGISLIIFSGIVAETPGALVNLFESGRTGAISTAVILGVMVLAVGVICFVVFIERAQRRIVIQYPKRRSGNRFMGGEHSHLPLKLNSSGVIPPIFAGALLSMPITVVSFNSGQGPEWLTAVTAILGRGQPLYLLIFSSLIAFFAFFYTAVVFNPAETADNLRRHDGFVPGIRPGKNTAEYLDFILTRLTVVGALYLVLVCLMPEILIANAGIPFYFGGTSLLIVVSVTMDTVAQIHSHLLAHQYEGLIRKTKLRGARR